MIKVILKYLLLLAVFVLIAHWLTVSLWITSIGQKQLFTEIKSSPLIDFIYAKTGVRLTSFRIVSSPKLYGQMIGIPGHPYMIFSSAVDKQFTDSEKEYLVLHEVGHYITNQAIIETVAFIALFIFGCFIVRKSRWWTIPFIGIISGLIYIQVGTYNEYTADHFALKHITDPQGMITATSKFKAQQWPRIDDNSVSWKLLLRSTPYYVRVNMANQEIESRRR